MPKLITTAAVLLFMSVVSAGAQSPPRSEAAMLVISKETLTLTVLDADSVAIVRYPVAAGRNYGNKARSGDMRTPEGSFTVENIQDASWWTHDFGDGKGDIKGAYGSHFIRLKTPPHKGIGIHGTHDPASIGTRATEGCIRLRNEDLKELVPLIRKGLPVVITASKSDLAADGIPTGGTLADRPSPTRGY